MKHCGILLLLLCLGCGQESAPPVPARSGEAEIFDKVCEIEAWGFHETARDWYQKLSRPPYTQTIRQRAFQKWIALLQKQGDADAQAAVQEQMLRAFPAEGPTLRKALLKYHLTRWQWDKAAPLVKALLRAGDAQRKFLDNLLVWFERWQNRRRQVRWREDFYPPPLNWSLAHPTHYKIDPLKRELDATTVTKSWYHAGKRFYWRGDSTLLAFDIQIKKIDWTGLVSCGIFTLTGPQCLLADFGCSGGTGNLHFHVNLKAAPDAERRSFPATGITYATDTWYHIELDYLQEIRQACLAVWKRDDKQFLGKQIVTFARPLPPGDYLIGLAMPPQGNHHPTARAKIALDNMLLAGGSWGRPHDKPSLKLIYQLNALARKNPRQAIQHYTRLVSQSPDNWRFWEMRAYLWQDQGQIDKFLDDWKQVLKHHPGHPNRDYFQRLRQR